MNTRCRSRIAQPFLTFAVALIAGQLMGAEYYVSPTGNDLHPGTSNLPFATPQKAVTLSTLAAGDTIYLRGGTYSLDAQIKPSKNGTAADPIRLWAVPGEQPVFDFATMGGSNKALDLRRNYWHARGIEVKNAPSNGIFVGGRGNIVEGCIIHDCNNDGLVLGSTSIFATNSLILNCDSYRNYEVGSGGDNGDGFAAKNGCGPGNVFQDCRAWSNADDGWDFYNNNHSVVLIGCWAMNSGYDLWGVGAGWSGNGNGFKLGGAGTTGQHYLTNCVAWGNRSKGFDHNHSTAGQTVVNGTGYSNNVNFSFYETPTLGQNRLINNASYIGTATNLEPTTLQLSNSWQIASVTASDFASLDTALALLPRNADYTLQSNAFLRLAPGSDLIDRGMNVGLPFNGTAPDLGAFERSAAPPQGPLTLSSCQWLNGGFQMQIGGLTAHGPVVVYASSNLLEWAPLHTNPPALGSLDYTDTNASTLPSLFYRAAEQ